MLSVAEPSGGRAVCGAGLETGGPGRRVMWRRGGVRRACARSVALSGRVSRYRAMPAGGRRSEPGAMCVR